MQPPVKDQTDLGVDNPTLDASDGPDNKDTARQEFKQEADLHYTLERFGIVPRREAPIYGEWDDSIELQTALESVKQAKEGYRNLPQELRDKFGSMEEMLQAVENGSLVFIDGEAPPPVKTQEQINQERLDNLEKVAMFNKAHHTEA